MILDTLRKLICDMRAAADKLDAYRFKAHASTVREWSNTLESACIAIAHREEIRKQTERPA